MSVKPPKITPKTGGAVPPGYLLGRTTRGRQKGPAQLISVQLLAAMGVVTKATLRSLAFLDLSDTPKTYASQGTKFVQVNGGETALVFTTAVVPTGSPVSGNLTKFSGVSSVTNGDLSGAVTTSGTLVTTAANPFQIGTPYIRTGNGAGPGTDPEGSLYLRTDNGLAYSQFLTASASPARVQDKVVFGSFTGSLPGTPTPGNVIVAVCFATVSPSAASGWTSILSGNDAVAGVGTLYRLVVYRYVQAGDTSSYTPFTGTPGTMSLHEVSGVDQVNFNNSLASVQGGTSADLGTVSLSFTTTSNHNFAILSAVGVSDSTLQTTTLGGTTTWTNQSAASSATIGSAAITTSGTVVNGTATFSGGFGDRYTGECMVVLNPPPATQDTGLQQVSYLTVLKNGGSAFSTNPRSINFSTGTSASDDGEGNITVTGGVTNIATSGLVTGGPITGTGTISLSTIGAGHVVANSTNASAVPADTTVTALLDQALGNTQGNIIYRNASAWVVLAPGTNGYSLTSGGAGANVSWTNVAGGGGGGVTSVAAGDGANFNTITTTGSVTVANVQPQGRLSLTSAVAVLTANATAQGTIYYVEDHGNSCPVWNGSNMQPITFTNLSCILDATNAVSGSVYDVFLYNNSGATLGFGPAWSSTTSRGTGAGTTELVLQNGIWVNKNAITLHNNSVSSGSLTAKTATYLGTFYATANGQTGMNFNPAAAGGGTNNILGLWNAYNRVRVAAYSRDNTASWAYSTNTWRKTNAGGTGSGANNRISYVDGLQKSTVSTTITCAATASGTAGYIGVNLDATTGAPNNVAVMAAGSVEGTAQDYFLPQLGFHFLQGMENTNGAAVTFIAVSTSAQVQGLLVSIDM